MGASIGAETDRMLGSFGLNTAAPDDVFADDGFIIGDRGEWLYENDPIAHALVDTLVNGAVGSRGLQFRSMYSADDKLDTTPEEDAIRRQINASIDRARRHTRFDAAGRMTSLDLLKAQARQAILTGSAFSQRLWKPDRPGVQVQATCVRLIHSSRVSNPQNTSNTDVLVNGFQLDESNGTPLGIWVRKSHPRIVWYQRFVWDYIPLHMPDGGSNVTYLPSFTQPDQIRGPGWLNQIIPLLRFLGKTMEAKVVADLMKASIGLIVECDDPAKMAQQDRNGAVLTNTTKFKPGMKYYVKKGTVWKEWNTNYNGQDFSNWGDFLLKIICANFQIPFEFVMQQLTQTNLAASRVALIQAYRTFASLQEWLIAYVEDHWNQWIIAEDIARGRLPIAVPDVETIDRVFSGRYLRPARPFPDPLKEAQAAVIRTQQLGFSLSGAHSEQGADFEEQVVAQKLDKQVLVDNDVSIAPMNGQTPASIAEDEGDDAAGEGQPAGSGGTSNSNAPAKTPQVSTP